MVGTLLDSGAPSDKLIPTRIFLPRTRIPCAFEYSCNASSVEMRRGCLYSDIGDNTLEGAQLQGYNMLL